MAKAFKGPRPPAAQEELVWHATTLRHLQVTSPPTRQTPTHAAPQNDQGR